ncbi:MAG: glycoside hydrolase family 65 protein, partial [Spirochaetia bacterium]
MGINYNAGTGNEKNWIIEETNYRPEYSGKFETIFSLGNGYMGSRSATEEAYACQRKGTFIAGLFNAFPEEVTELVNIPDWTNAEIYIRGERMNLLSGKVLHYSRRLNMKAGTVTRSFTWVSASGKETQFEFERFLSLADLHLAVLNIKIRPVNYSGDIQILSGIDGQQTNSGVQHFLDAALRHYENGSIGYTARTTASKETLYINSHCMVSSSGEIESTSHIQTDRRYIAQDIRVTAAEKQEFCFQKYTSFWTSRDREFIHEKDVSASVLMERGKKTINAAREKSFQELKKEHAIRWSRIWDRMDIQIEGPDFDQLGLRFSMFHMFQMAPVHDDRISIAAKGLSGEGYKGHVFWDAEIFNIPFYTYTFPEHACSLLTYRYNCLDGARRKARSNGWAGAMFPWESAATGDEVTPKWGAVDIKTGEPIRIWTGELEQHITCDVFYAMWMYCKITGDLQFFYSKFLEVMIETARYWVDRLEYDAETDVYEITGIIGPDEFGENVNNNGFTNYMVKWQLKKSFAVSENLFQNDSASWKQITEKLKLKRDEPLHWKE